MKEGLFFLLLAVVVFQPGKGQEQALCYNTQQDCMLNGSFTVAASARSCCLGDGMSFRSEGSDPCEVCVVYGWRDGSTFAGTERRDPYNLQVGFIKGTQLSYTELTLNIISGTAERGANLDFTANQQVILVGPNPVDVPVVLQVDQCALEQNEQFQLQLQTDDDQMSLQSNEFLLDTITITIVDNDSVWLWRWSHEELILSTVVLQFTESDYESNEAEGEILIQVQRLGSIASDLVFSVVPLNYTQVNVSDFFLAEDIPTVPNFDELRPNIAKSSTDFNSSLIVVTMVADGNSNQIINVAIPVEDDTINEATQVFVALIEVDNETVNPAAVRVLRNSTLCIITDNDPIRIGFEQPSYTFDESSFSTVFLIKEGNQTSEQTFEILVEVFDPVLEDFPGAIFNVDYDIGEIDPRSILGRTKLLLFSPDKQMESFDFELIGDDVYEGTEVFAANAALDIGGVVYEDGNFTHALVFIIDNDSITIGFEQATFTVEEGLVVEVCTFVTNGTLGRDATVTLSSINDEAFAPGDYDAVSDVLTFSATVTRICRSVSSVEDAILEDVESFILTLTITDGVVNLTPDEARVTITDDDQITIGFEEILYTATEGVDRAVELCAIVQGGGVLERNVVVTSFTRDGSATSTDPNDYIATTVVLTFGPGNNRQCLNVSIVNDVILEETEQFFASLTTTDLTVLLNPDEALISISPEDQVVIGFERMEYSVLESFPFVEVCVVLQPRSILETTVSVNLFTSGATATPGEDYVQIPLLVAIPLVFDPTNSRRCVNITILDNSPLENTESFFGQLDTVFSTVMTDPQQTSVSIIDNDGVVIGFNPTLYTVSEDDGEVFLTVRVLQGTLERPALIDFSTANGLGISAAVAPDDYTTITDLPLIFDGNGTSQRVRIITANDSIVEFDEHFFGSLVTADPFVEIMLDEARVNILDDDRVTIGFQPVLYSVEEEDGFATVSATVLQGALARAVLVEVEITTGTASLQDFTATSVQLIFSPIMLIRDVSIPITDDDVTENVETFFATLTHDADQPVDLNPLRAEIRILDNVDRLTIGFERSTYTVEEGLVAEICILVISGTLERDATITLSTVSDKAMAPEDYDVISEDVTFSASMTRYCRNVSTVEDAILEDSEDFTLKLTTTDGSVNLNPDEARVTIADDDRVTIGFRPVSYSIEEEDGFVIVSATVVQGTLARSIMIDFETVAGTASLLLDFSDTPVQLMFTPTVLIQNVSISITDDSIVESVETFFATLTLDDDQPVDLSLSQAEISILQSDNVDRITVGLEQTTYTVEEGLMVEVCIFITSGSLERDAIVTLTTISDEAVAPGDYDAISEELVFSANTTRICRNVSSAEDTFSENNEDFVLSLTTSDGGINLTPDEASVSILDDDRIPIIVNDTIAADPLMTVPLNIENTNLLGLNTEKIVSLCFELHGADDVYLNLVSDGCASVNAHYVAIDPDLDINIIDAITVRAVDANDSCKCIAVSLQGCSLSIDGFVIDSYSVSGIAIRKYHNRIRISVPNCADQDLVMWVVCQNGTLKHPETREHFTLEMIRFVIARGFNLNERSHGILGQFWNIQIEVEPYTGVPINVTDVFTVVVNHPDSEARRFLGCLLSLTWERERRPCLYAGNREAGAADIAEDPNDSIIQGSYTDYRVSGPFATNFMYSHFEESRCY